MKKRSFIHAKFNSMLGAAFVSIAIPMILQISDSVITGNIIGVDGVSAVNLITPVYSFVAFLGTMVSAGGTILYTRAIGSFDREKMSQLYSVGLIAIAFISVVCFLASLLFSDLYLESYGVNDQILFYAKEYCHYYHFVFLLTPFFLYLSEMVFAEGDELVTNICYVVYCVGNVAVSIPACFIMGIRGVGFGSFVGCLLALLVLLVHFFRKTNQLRFHWYFSIRDLLAMAKFSFLDASAYLYSALSISTMNIIIIQRFGDAYLPVYSAVIAMIELTVILDGVGEAMLPLVNVFRGEKNGAGEKDIVNYALKVAAISGVVYAIIVNITAQWLPAAFGVKDPEIYSLAVTATRLLGISAIVISIIYLLSSYYLISEHILYASFMICMNSLVFPVAVGYILSYPLGINGLWVGNILAAILVLVMTIVYIYLRYGKERIPTIYEPEMRDIEIFNLTLNVSEIMETRDKMDEAMLKRNISQKQRNSVMLLCEELMQLILERNKGRKILAECTLLFDDELQLIIRDSGTIFDITDEDLNITSLRSMTVSSLMTHIRVRDHLVTTSYNRNVFRIPQ